MRLMPPSSVRESARVLSPACLSCSTHDLFLGLGGQGDLEVVEDTLTVNEVELSKVQLRDTFYTSLQEQEQEQE